MIRRQHKKYSKPRKLFDNTRISSENKLVNHYGLKNKKEIWKADFAIGRLRGHAKKLITASSEKQQEFLDRLIAKGLLKSNAKIDDVLALTKEAILERRLQTIVFKKNMTKTAKEARQLITHRHIQIGDKIVTIPSYFVDLNEEAEISKRIKQKKEKMKEEKLEINNG